MSTATSLGDRRTLPTRVFVSYSYDRMRSQARALVRALHRSGAEVLEPADVSPGEDLRTLVASRIKNSDLMVVLVSPGDESSRWMLFETRIMLETCWERPEARIAVVAPAVGAIPPALRHQAFARYYPYSAAHLDGWASEEATAESFATELISLVGREASSAAERMSDREIRRWRNRVVHVGATTRPDDAEQRRQLRDWLREDLSHLVRSVDRAGVSRLEVEEILDRAILAAALEDRSLSIAYYEAARQGYAALDQEQPREPASELQYRLAVAALAAGDGVGAHDLLEETVRRRTSDLGQDHIATISCRIDLGKAKELVGQLLGAADEYTGALEAARRVLGDRHPLTADVAGRLGALHATLGDHEAAKELLEFAEKAYDLVRPEDSRELADIRRRLTELAADQPDG